MGVTSSSYDVLIVGAGPTGLTLAGELALAGINVAIVERRANQDLEGSRAGGLHSRTIEVFDQRGIADRFLAEGQTYPSLRFHIPLNMADFPTRHNYILGLSQNRIERILADWVGELNVPILRGEATSFVQEETGVDLMLTGGRLLRAEYLVGCDGGRSRVRKTAGIAFPGWEPTTSWLIAEVKTAREPQWGFHEDATGRHAIARGDDGSARMVLTEAQLQSGSEATLGEVSGALAAIYGTDYGIHSPTWISRFTDMTRQAAVYRDKRVLLAGDAAHAHPPLGGQGLNIGVQDAMNLGWKLAQVIKSTAPESLLDTYHTERHPLAARVLRNTMAQVALRRPDHRSKALGDTVAELLGMDEPRRRIAAEISGLDIHYQLGTGHPLLGRRIPDLDLLIADDSLRVFSLLHGARPLLLNLGKPGSFPLGPWADRIRVIEATYAGAWNLPVLGVVAAPEALLIRPDGYVAWTADSGAALRDALTTWFGPPAEGVHLSARPEQMAAAAKVGSHS
jgi:3-(3-hydroxy-phenyl)propionate hydroxylase